MRTLFLAYFFFLSFDAQANFLATINELNTHNTSIINKLEYIKTNAHRCTSHSGAVKDAVNEALGKLNAMNERLNGAAATFINNSINESVCVAPSTTELNNMNLAAKFVQSELAKIQTVINENDEDLLWLFAGYDNPSHPCKNTIKGDENSSEVSLAYQAVKKELVDYKNTNDKIMLELAALPNTTVPGGTTIASTDSCTNQNSAALQSNSFVLKASFGSDRGTTFIQGNNSSLQAL